MQNYSYKSVLRLMLLLLFSHAGQTLFAQLPCQEPAMFSWTTTEVPCTVKFTPANTGTGHLWDFGDGTPVSNEFMPTHTYNAPGGTFVVKHTYANVNGGGTTFINTCYRTVTVNCAINQVTETIECCKLTLRISGGFPNETHAWTLGGGCYTSTDADPTIILENLNTALTPNIVIRHVVTNSSGVVLSDETFTHTYTHTGLFVGDADNPFAHISYVNLTGCLNGGVNLFPTNTVAENLYVYSTLDVDRAGGVQFVGADVCMASKSGIDLVQPSTNNPTLRVISSTLHHECEAWRGINVAAACELETQLSTIRGAVLAVRPFAGAILDINNTDFSQDYVGIYAANGAYTMASFQGNKFFAGGSLPPHDGSLIGPSISLSGGYSTALPFAGILHQNTPMFGINSTTTFDALANGIFLDNSFTDTRIIGKCVFSNMKSTSAYTLNHTGHGVMVRQSGATGNVRVRNNRFGVCAYGVREISYTPGASLSVDFNLMGNVDVGVSLEQYSGGRFDNTIVENNRLSVNFTGVSYHGGGSANQSNIQIINNAPGANPNAGIFTHGKGISFVGAVNQTGVSAAHNQINVTEEGEIGVWLDMASGTTVDDNEVFITTFGVKYGIFVLGSISNTISNNLVKGTYNPTGAPFDMGLFAEKSQDNTISGNTFERVGFGARFSSNCSMPGKFRCNHFKGNKYGLYFDNFSQIGAQFETGNHWEDPGFLSGALIGAAHEGGIFNIQESMFTTLQGAATDEYPHTFQLQPGIIPGNWFLAGAPSTACGMKPARFVEQYVEKDIRQNDFSGEAGYSYQQPSGHLGQPNDAVVVVSPNPAQDVCSIRVAASVTESQSVQYQFFNVLGAGVLAGELAQGVVAQQVALTGLPDGVYVYKLTQSGREIGQGKLVVTNR